MLCIKKHFSETDKKTYRKKPKSQNIEYRNNPVLIFSFFRNIKHILFFILQTCFIQKNVKIRIRFLW